MIAAIYAALTIAGGALSFIPTQFRISEALSILPIFTPAAIPGLVIGCFIANFVGSPFGLIDIVGGTFATLLAVIVTRQLRNITFKGIPFLAPLPAVLFNALIVGAYLVVAVEGGSPNFGKFTFAAFVTSAVFVGIGQLVVCYGLGLPLAIALKKSGVSRIFNLK